MKNTPAKEFIKYMLGESNIDIELEDKDYEIIEQHTLDVLAPYYTGTKYIYGNGNIVDLSNYPEVTTIHQIFESEGNPDDFLKMSFFGAPGVYLWDSNTMNSYLNYVSLKTLYDNFRTMKSMTWKYVKPKVYLHGYDNRPIILECYVRPTSFADIDKASSFYPLAKQYALALAKEIVGRTRSKFTINGAPYNLDGTALLQEAQAEKQDVLARIIPPIRVY